MKDEYIEVEVIDNKKEKIKKERIKNKEIPELKQLKKIIMLRGLSALIMPILFILGILLLISLVFYWLFAEPFNYIILGIFWLWIFKIFYNLKKMLK